MQSPPNLNRAIVKKGFELIKASKNYKQTQVVNKIRYFGYQINQATLSKILRGKPISEGALFQAAKGINEVLKIELGKIYDQNLVLLKTEVEKTEVVPEVISDGLHRSGFVFYPDGRQTMEQKVRFFTSATKEWIEFGLTLNTFSRYFYSIKESAFKAPVKDLLKKGVHVKCYLIDPESNYARLYFADRESVIQEEQLGIEKIKTAIHQLLKVSSEFEKLEYPGKFEIFKYRHMPTAYYMAVDPQSRDKAKILVSSYLFGERRANCPVVEISRKSNPMLFLRYLDSLNKMMAGARKVT